MQIRDGILFIRESGREDGLKESGRRAAVDSEKLEDRQDEQSYGSRSKGHGFDRPIDRISHGWLCGVRYGADSERADSGSNGPDTSFYGRFELQAIYIHIYNSTTCLHIYGLLCENAPQSAIMADNDLVRGIDRGQKKAARDILSLAADHKHSEKAGRKPASTTTHFRPWKRPCRLGRGRNERSRHRSIRAHCHWRI